MQDVANLDFVFEAKFEPSFFATTGVEMNAEEIARAAGSTVELIEQLVTRQGGALLMIGGRRFAPVSRACRDRPARRPSQSLPDPG